MDGIAELERKLRRAYVAKELEAQMAEREAERYVEKARKQRGARRTVLEERAALEEEDLRRRFEDRCRSEEYASCLKGQMARKREEGRIEREEARRERELLANVDGWREEREREERRRLRKNRAGEAGRERASLEERREIRRREEAEAEERKVLEDLEYRREIEERSRETRRLREERAERRELLLRAAAGAMLEADVAPRRRRREREALITELLAEDAMRELEIRQREEAARRATARTELAAALEEQIVLAERCKLRFLEQDRAFAEEILGKIREDERIARLTASARRRMELQHREDLRRLIEQRRKIREREIARFEEADEDERRRRRMRIERIRGERKRLLREHASNVGDFLDKAALTTEELDILAASSKIQLE